MRWPRVLTWAGGGLAGALLLAFLVLQTPIGLRGLASLVSSLASSPQSRVEISGLHGFFPTDLKAERIALADKDGAWLTVEEARVDWSFLPLFSSRLRIETLSARRVALIRPPAPSTEPVTATGGTSRPSFEIDVASLEIGELQIAPAFAGVDSRWRIAGRARLAKQIPETRLALNAERTDQPTGRLSAEIRFDEGFKQLVSEIALEEKGEKGVAAALLGRPDLTDFMLKLRARGDEADGQAELTLAAGDAASGKGVIAWKREDDLTRASLRVTAGAPGLPDGPLARLFRAPVNVEADATLDTQGFVLTKATLESGFARIVASGPYRKATDSLEITAAIDAARSEPLSGFVAPASWRDLHADVKVTLTGVSTKPQGKLVATFKADDVVAAPLPVPALGKVDGSATLALRPDGGVRLEAFDAQSALASLKATGDVIPLADLKATLTVADLAAFSPLATIPLGGNGSIDFTVKTTRDRAAEIAWQGAVRNVTVENVPAEALAPEIKLAGALSARGDEWRMNSIRVATDAASLTVDGSGKGGTGAFDLTVSVPRLSTLAAAATGTVDATAKVTMQESGAAGIELKVTGLVENQPLSLTGRAGRDAAGRLTVPELKGQWASAAIDVTDFVLERENASGTGKVVIKDLADIGRLVDQTLAGSLELDLAADGNADSDKQQDKLQAKLAMRDLRGIDGVSRIDATLKSDLKTGEVAVQAAGPGLAGSIRAEVEPTEQGVRIAISQFDARQGTLPVRLVAATRGHLIGSRFTIEQPVKLAVMAGTVTVTGAVDPAASDLNADVAGIPLSAAGVADADGILQAKVRIRGALAAPRIEGTYAINGLRVRRPEGRFLPVMAVTGSGSLVGSQAAFDAKLAGGATALNVKGTATVPRGRAPLALSAKVTGLLDLQLLSSAAGTTVSGLAGRLQPDLDIKVSGNDITGSGRLTMTGASLRQPASGLALERGEAVINLRGQSLQIERLAFQTGSGGTITSTGTIQLDMARGFPVDVQVNATKALLANRPDLVATISSALRLQGSMTDGFTVSGPVTVDRAEINIGVGQSADYPTIEVREINKPGVANTPVVARAGPPPPKPVAGPSVKLNIQVEAPRAVFVRGRGLEAEVGGRFAIGGLASQPAVTGALNLRRGEFNLLGRRLNFTRGNVSLVRADSIEPMLDFVATTTAGDTTINVEISGTSRAPKIALSSSPSLPQDEVMARLLFGRTKGSLSAFEALQVAQAVAELTGITQGPGLVGGLRKRLGLDRLSLDSGSDGLSSTSASGGRYVAPGVYIGAKQGASANSSRGVVEVEVFKNTKIEGDIGADSNGRVGIKMEWDY